MSDLERANKTQYAGQRILIIGAARQGIALARYMAQEGAVVLLNDNRSAEQLAEASAELKGLPIRWILGEHPLELLEGVDLVCPSGGVPLTIPLVVEARVRGIRLSNDSQIFMEQAPCKIVGITGSAGKTTTTTLVGRMAACEVREEQTEKQVWVGGNIGHPLISDLDQMKPGDLAVMELSSFQLELMNASPEVAAVLNITPNHLDRHGSMAAYTEAKARILSFQNEEDTAVLGRDDLGSWALAEAVRGELVSFGTDLSLADQAGSFRNGEHVAFWDGEAIEDLIPIQDIQVRGAHNLQNVLAASAIATAAGISAGAMRAGIAGFQGVPHRLEFVRSWGGADWYNDSMATSPERAIAAIKSFDEPLVVLLGGRDKDLPWEDLTALVSDRVDHVVLFGETAEKIESLIRPIRKEQTVVRCGSLSEAVQAAAEIVEPGDVVLLSPGGTSYDAFKDYAERGEHYRLWVNMLP